MNNIIKVEVRKTYVFKDANGGEIHLHQIDKPWNGLVKLMERPALRTGNTSDWIIVAGLADYQESISDIIASVLTVEKDRDSETRELAIISGTPSLINRLLKPVTT